MYKCRGRPCTSAFDARGFVVRHSSGTVSILAGLGCWGRQCLSDKRNLQPCIAVMSVMRDVAVAVAAAILVTA